MRKVVENIRSQGIFSSWINVLECGHKFYAKRNDIEAKYATKRKCKICESANLEKK